MCAKCQAFRGSIALMPPTQCSVTALWHDDRSLCRVKCPECSGRGGSGQTLLVLYRNDRQNFDRVSRIPQRQASLELYFHQTLEYSDFSRRQPLSKSPELYLATQHWTINTSSSLHSRHALCHFMQRLGTATILDYIIQELSEIVSICV